MSTGVELPAATTTQTKLGVFFAFLVFVLGLSSWVSAHDGFDEQIAQANLAISSDPTDPQHLLVRAELYRHHRNFVAALSDLDAASRLAPELHSVHYFRGLTYLDATRYNEAEAALRGFLERKPVHPAGHESRARALRQLGRPLEAAREYDLAIDQQPVPVPDHYYERALAYRAAGDEYLEEALRGIDAGIGVIGPVPGLERVAIDLELRRGATDAALARLERVILRSARREAWLVQRAEILTRAGRSEEAKQSFALALAALDQLSTPRRRTPAMSLLEAEIRAGMSELENAEMGISK